MGLSRAKEFRISEILAFAFYAQTPIVRTARLASAMEGEGFLVLCADVIAIEIVDVTDDDASINGADDDASINGADDDASINGADDDASINSADDDAFINGADSDVLIVVPDSNPVGAVELIHVGSKRRRELGSCWKHLTNDINPRLTPQSKFKASNSILKHHKKSERVKSHLNNCNSFLNSLADVHVEDLPSWIVVKSLQSKSAMNEKQVTSRVSSQDIRCFALPNLSNKDLGAFHELLAMHFYMTGTTFARIEESHLVATIQKLRLDVTLPSRK
jgi:hypothetical protein